MGSLTWHALTVDVAMNPLGCQRGRYSYAATELGTHETYTL